MKYSFNRDRKDLVFAQASNINASFKDLSAVCDAIRYENASVASMTLDLIAEGKAAVRYKRYNKGMGSRHELGGRKGRYPAKCASEVRRVLTNAIANARNKGLEPDVMYVAHASANKTVIMRRSPPKGILYKGAGYGYVTSRSSDLEFAKIEIALAKGTEPGLSKRMASRMKTSGQFTESKIKAMGGPAVAGKKDRKAKAQKDQKRQNKDERPKKSETSAEEKAPQQTQKKSTEPNAANAQKQAQSHSQSQPQTRAPATSGQEQK